MDDSHGKAHADAALMMLQALILALLDRGMLSPEDMRRALVDVIEAQQSGESDPAFRESVLRVLTSATEGMTTR